ncbi:MAG: hypothetical protein NTW21_17330 [Verrucomicrobia bacterium]|nr:hypothetical protein [Verrucomicrobiota bacterium]
MQLLARAWLAGFTPQAMGPYRLRPRPDSQFLIPAENELALVGVSDAFVNHPRIGLRVAAVPLRGHVLLLLEH